MKSAFTLIEALIVVSILTILAGVASLSLVSYSKTVDSDNSRGTIISALRQAESNSMANVGGKPWGIHLENSKLTIFNDSVFNPADLTNQVKALSSANLSWNLGGNSQDIIFEQGKSTTANYGIININSNNPSQVVINSEGMIE